MRLFTTMKDHIGNCKESIELFSKHSTHDSASAMFYSKLSALERMLQQVDKKVKAKASIEDIERKAEMDALGLS